MATRRSRKSAPRNALYAQSGGVTAVINASACGVIEACRANGVAVMAIRIFGAGVIATDERHGRESILVSNTTIAEEERKTRAVFEAIGEGEGTRAQVALRFVLSNPDVSCAVIGSSELRHIDEALAAAERGPLPAATLARLEALYESDFAT